MLFVASRDTFSKVTNDSSSRDLKNYANLYWSSSKQVYVKSDSGSSGGSVSSVSSSGDVSLLCWHGVLDNAVEDVLSPSRRHWTDWCPVLSFVKAPPLGTLPSRSITSLLWNPVPGLPTKLRLYMTFNTHRALKKKGNLCWCGEWVDLCRTVSDGVSGVSYISYRMLGERYCINTKRNWYIFDGNWQAGHFFRWNLLTFDILVYQ